MSDFSADLPDFLNEMVENDADVTPTPLDPIEPNPYSFPDTTTDVTEPAPEPDTTDTTEPDSTPVLEPVDEEVTESVAPEEPAPVVDDAPAPAEPVEDVPVIDVPSGLEDGVAGNHFLWSDDWFWQEVDGYCGPTAAAFLLNQFQDAGISNPEYMVERAVSLGLMGDPTQGMYTDDLATLPVSYTHL